MTENLKIDPEFRALIRPLSVDERSQLEENLKTDGCRDPLAVWCGTILDGHNRYEICTRLKIEFAVSEVKLEDRISARIWIRWNQLGRRNLTEGQRAMQVAALIEDQTEVSKRERAKTARAAVQARNPMKPDLQADASRKSEPPSKAGVRPTAASKAGISERKVRKAQFVRKAAPALAAKVEAGTVTLEAAHKQATREVKEAEKTKIPENLPIRSERFRLIHGDMAKVEIEPNSIDWIITDPPYPQEFIPLYAELIRFASRNLKMGGGLLAMCGQSYLPQIFSAMTDVEQMHYQWTLAYLTPGGQSVQLWERKVNTFWKPVVWFVKGKYEGNWIGDVSKSVVNDNDKDHHHWGQSESGMADLLNRFTFPGQTICDPFLGGGTTGVVSVRMNRKFIGIDIDKACIDTAAGRLTL